MTDWTHSNASARCPTPLHTSGRRFDAHVIQSIVGHSDVATTRGYQYVDLTLQRAALSNLGGGVLM